MDLKLMGSDKNHTDVRSYVQCVYIRVSFTHYLWYLKKNSLQRKILFLTLPLCLAPLFFSQSPLFFSE